MTNPNGTNVEYSYDTQDRLTEVENRKTNNDLLSRYAYGLNNRDVRTYVERQKGTQAQQRINYTYNDLDELTREKATETTALTNVPFIDNEYSYDAMGNRNNKIARALDNTRFETNFSNNGLNQATDFSATPFDALNNAGTTVNYTDDYDLRGNLSYRYNDANSASTTLTYSDDDQLTSVYQTDASGANNHISNWEYDGLGRKTFTREFSWDATANNNQGDWSHDSDKRYIYDGMDVVQERDWNNDVTANYTRVGNIGGLLGKSTPNGSATDHLYYHYDGGGNVVQLTSSAGNSVGEYSYDAYGNATRVWGYAAQVNTYRFSTKEWHAFTGLYSYGYRFYAPQLGRWINRDPIRERGGFNLYAMVQNSPVNYVDPTGMILFPIVIGVGVAITWFAYEASYNPANAPGPNDFIYSKGEKYSENVTEYAATTLVWTRLGPEWKKLCPTVRRSIQVHEAHHRSMLGVIEQLDWPMRMVAPGNHELMAYKVERRWLKNQLRKMSKNHPDRACAEERLSEVEYYIKNPHLG